MIVLLDETSPDFWEEVEGLGWYTLDHKVEQTANLYGTWYPTLIDIAAQSLSVGFAGTVLSTFSLVSAKRVEAWNDGVMGLVSRPRETPSLGKP